MAGSDLQYLVERMAALVRADQREVAARHDLKLTQLEALAYLATANRYSDTPAGLTDYLGLTKGTVSQTLIALENKGLIQKHPDESDGRLVHCRPTKAGRAIAAEVTPVPTIGELEAGVAEEHAAGLRGLLSTLQRQRGGRTFGLCRTCSHFQREPRGFRCGLTGEKLSREDSLLHCREHAPDGGEA